jgi:hypothetical protein
MPIDPRLAETLRKRGEILRKTGQANSVGGQDSILAHITPREAMLLKRLGGSGRVDPITGGLHFEEGGDGGDPGDDGEMGNAPGTDGTDSSGNHTDNSGDHTNDLNSFDVGTDMVSGVHGAVSGYNDTSLGPGGSYGGVVSDSLGNAVTDSKGDPVGFGGYYSDGGAGQQGMLFGGTWDASKGTWQADPYANQPGNIGYDPSKETDFDTVLGSPNTGKSAVEGSREAAMGETPNSLAVWQTQNPTLSALAQLALFAADPLYGAIYGAGSAANRGDYLGAIGGGLSAGVPQAAPAINAFQSLGRGDLSSLLSSLANYGINASGSGLGELLSSQFSPNTYASSFAGGLGSSVQNTLANELFSGIPSASVTGSSQGTAEGDGASSTDTGSALGYTADNYLPVQSVGTESRQAAPVTSLDSILPSGKEGQRRPVWNQSSLRDMSEGV